MGIKQKRSKATGTSLICWSENERRFFFYSNTYNNNKKRVHVVMIECSSFVNICSVLCSSNQDLPGLRKNFGQQLQRFFRSNDLEFVKILFNHRLASTLFGWKEDTIYLMSIALQSFWIGQYFPLTLMLLDAWSVKFFYTSLYTWSEVEGEHDKSWNNHGWMLNHLTYLTRKLQQNFTSAA